MAEGYTTVAAAVEHELEIRKSRFRCLIAPADTEETAREWIAARRTEHWNANHNCTAFVLGADSSVQRSSDDGEPSGTAGVPMLEVLTRRGLTYVVAVVTRYFGGVKLGAGGLIRAYGQSVSDTADRARLVRWEPRLTVAVTADHQLAGRLENDLRTAGYVLADVTYTADVTFQVAIIPDQLDRFTAWLDEATSGGAAWEPGDTTYHQV